MSGDNLWCGRVMVAMFAVMLTLFVVRTEAQGKEQSVEFAGAGGATLSGTILRPADSSPSKRPGMVLLQGSGPTDRDGNAVGVKVDTLRNLAEALAAEGIVTLRYDKRGQFASKSPEANKNDLFEFCKWSNYVQDAEAALRMLRSQTEVDPDKTGFVGHSEGGLISLQAACELQIEDKAPACLVLVATGGRMIESIIHDQIARALKSQEATAEQIRYYLGELDRVFAAVKQSGKVPKDVPVGLAPLFPDYMGKYLQGVMEADPVKFASAYKGPVMILQGAADVQVSATRDMPLLDAALKARPAGRHKTVLIPRASHNLRIVTGNTDDGLSGQFATQALDDLRYWVRVTMAGVSKPN